jgi:hypothetical protein
MEIAVEEWSFIGFLAEQVWAGHGVARVGGEGRDSSSTKSREKDKKKRLGNKNCASGV